MKKQTYFYQFLEPLSKELAYVARELEHSIFTSPRTMLTHARTFVEAIIKQVIAIENLSYEPYKSFVEQLDLLEKQELINEGVRDALHLVRMHGNQAAHDVRQFRYSEALLSWEALHTIVTWYVEVYGPIHLNVPAYQDPEPNVQETYDMVELQIRLDNMEHLLTNSLEKLQVDEVETEAVATTSASSDEKNIGTETPGMTTVRKIAYQDEIIHIPYFLRDAFLLPQRFEKSERFLVRLGAEEQARIMSELPANLSGLHKHVKRYNETNDKNFFDELSCFIAEEKTRRQLILERLGELFLFYKDDYLVVTEKRSQIALTTDNFKGIPSLINQLNEDDIHFVGQLPQELVILAKYKNVGIGTVENLFAQIKAKL